jgi:hypothetical protein
MAQRLSSSKQGITSAAAVAWLGLCGCSGNGDGLDENGRPADGGGGPPPEPPAFTTIQNTILTPVCTGCHAGASAPRGLRLDDANSYAMLVGVASGEVPSLQRVQPGNADNSYLVQKIEGRAAVGGRMPLGGPPLSQADIDLIKQWIADGAPAPAASAAPNVFSKPQSYRLISSVPAGGETSPPIDELMTVLNYPVDSALAQSGAFELTASGGDAAFGDDEDIALQIAEVTVSLANPTVVHLKLRAPLTPDTYRLTLHGSGATALADVDSRVLDGNGDGVGGDDANVVFTVSEAQR